MSCLKSCTDLLAELKYHHKCRQTKKLLVGGLDPTLSPPRPPCGANKFSIYASYKTDWRIKCWFVQEWWWHGTIYGAVQCKDNSEVQHRTHLSATMAVKTGAVAFGGLGISWGLLDSIALPHCSPVISDNKGRLSKEMRTNMEAAASILVLIS